MPSCSRLSQQADAEEPPQAPPTSKVDIRPLRQASSMSGVGPEPGPEHCFAASSLRQKARGQVGRAACQLLQLLSQCQVLSC